MNILDKIKGILSTESLYLGIIPAKPDDVVAFFEYDTGAGLEHHFDRTDIAQGLQLRVRGSDALTAYSKAKSIVSQLSRYKDADISITQTSPVLDIGFDGNNPPRREYTANFTVRRL